MLDVIKFSYHRGCTNFGVNRVGIKAQIRLLELARLPKEIEILERDLAHKKRKLNKLLKGEQNEQ